MKGAKTKVSNMDELQLRLRDARKVISGDGYNNRFAQVFNDAIDMIEQLKYGSAWRPIETAPKDSSWFMVCCFEHDEKRYIGGKPLIVFYDGVNFITHGGMELASKGYYAPTHWMPLPAPPAGA